MSNALNVVNMLLEAQTVRVCAPCEQEHGAVPDQPGVYKSHGLCRRHALAAYTEAGHDTTRIMALPDEKFSPDLAESADNDAEARRFANDTGLTFRPVQYGAFSPKSWEFTDQRTDGGATQGFTFYAPVSATYDQMMALWKQKQSAIAT